MHNCNNAIICLVVLLMPTGCVPPPPPDGIRVQCDGSAVGFLWYEWVPVPGCSAYDPDCYIEHSKFPLCIDPNALEGETGADGDWVNDTEDLDYIRGRCAKECVNTNSPYAEPYANLFAICSDPNAMDGTHVVPND
jgi:hypothetical protein